MAHDAPPSPRQRFTAERGAVDLVPAWTTREIRAGVAALLAEWEHRLPADRGARIVVKPNLNNDLVALTGNCADLRVLDALLGGLRDRGYRDLTLADGSNVGVARRGISTFRRLRVEPLAARHGARIVDLNTDAGEVVVLHADARPHVARTILDAEFLISVPKVKTHAEAGLSCAMKNWVGITCGQDKRHMHYDLGRNILALNEAVHPDLILVDGVVGMEGNGPGDGDPFRLGRLAMSDDAFLNDLVFARVVDLPWEKVPYLRHAFEGGHLEPSLAERIAREIPVVRRIQQAPARSRLAELSEARSLLWLKRAVRPVVAQPAVAELAYKARIIQDVYSLEDDTLRLVSRNAEACGTCRRCEDFCPTELPLERIGVSLDAPDCIQCLYCWWSCPRDALKLEGERGFMSRQIERYKDAIERM